MKRKLLVLFFCLFATNIFAIDKENAQTKAGAQKFLSMILTQRNSKATFSDSSWYINQKVFENKISFQHEWWSDFFNDWIKKTYSHTFSPYPIVNWTAKSDCSSVITFNEMGLRYTSVVKENGEEVEIEFFSPPFGKLDLQDDYRMIINWNSVAEIKKDSYPKQVNIVGKFTHLKSNHSADAKMHIIFPSESIADRAAYAMEFLRIQCDLTSSTGF